MKKSLIFIFCLFLFNNCKKKEIDALPPVTQNGANTFGCLINGSAWVSTGKSFSFGKKLKPIEGGYEDNYNPILRNNVRLWCTRDDGTTMILYINNVKRPGTYPLSFNTDPWPSAVVPYSYGSFGDKKNFYITNIYHKGTVIITKADSLNNAVAGTFEFEGYNYDTKQTISITNGRFDFLYKL